MTMTTSFTGLTPGKNYWALLIGVALLQTGYLAKMALDRVSLLKHGREITLQVQPVDPRDIFRGDYVILGYDISQVATADASTGASLKNVTRGSAIYVTLAPSTDATWAVKGVSASYPPAVEATDVVLKGRVTYRRPIDGSGNENVSVRYGIESYFVPEGTGKALETAVQTQKMQAIIAVDADGTPAIKGLIINGERHVDPPLL